MKKPFRRQSRILCLRALFCYLSRGGKVTQGACLTYAMEEMEIPVEKDDFARLLLKTAVENMGKMKVVIKGYAQDIEYDKIAPINRALLIQGLSEMRYFETPPVVIINEYVELAKIYGEERTASFINGVLDGFRKNIGRVRMQKAETEKISA